MSQQHETYIVPLKIRCTKCQANNHSNAVAEPQWIEMQPPNLHEHFRRNLVVASVIVLCAVTLRSGALPALDEASDVILTAATDQSLLDDTLGKLSFVGAMFPESVLVFGEQPVLDLIIPSDGCTITHAWSEYAPYTAWQSDSVQVCALADGEVTGIAHGYDEERIVEVTGENNLTWLYGNIGRVSVSLGERVIAGKEIGQVLPGEDLVLEVRHHGRSINPATIFSK